MEDYPLNQSSWGRARQETLSAFHSISFWVVEVISAPLVALGMYFAIPSSVDAVIKAVVPIAAFSVWMLAVLSGVFLLSLVVAPYKQRNQARALLQARPKPIPLSNRDELIRALSEIQLTSGELLMAQEHLDDLEARSPNLVHVDAMTARDNAHSKYKQAINKLDAEGLVASEPFKSLISDLTGYISTQVWMKEAKPTIIGGDPQQFRIRTALEIFGRIASRVSEVTRKINELSGRVPHKGGSQTE